MTRLLLVLFLLYGGVAGGAQAPAAAPAPPDADTLFAKGVKLHQSGDILGAIEAYQDALAKEAGRIDARSNLGAAFVSLGRYAEAVEQYRKALEIDPDNRRVRFNLALAQYKGGNVVEAADELKWLVDREPQNRSARLLLADCSQQMGQDEAVVLLLSGRDAEYGDDRLYAYVLGNALVRRGEVERGQVYIDRLFQGGDSAEGHVLMGAAQLRRQDFRAALTELERAVALNPALPTVNSLYGRALMGMGRREDAADAFRKELTKNPNDFDANLYLGLLLKDDGKLDEALDRLKRADRLRPGDPRTLYGLGALHLAAGRVPEAQTALEALVKAVPEYTQGHVLLATIYYRQKDRERGDRERAIVERLRAERQAREPGASDELGAAYQGEPLPGEVPPVVPKKPDGAR